MKKYLITGLLVWIPLAITVWVLEAIVTTMDQTLLLFPPEWKPPIYIPGLGVVLTVLVVMLTGIFVSNFLGQKLLIVWEGILKRIPVVVLTTSRAEEDVLTACDPHANAYVTKPVGPGAVHENRGADRRILDQRGDPAGEMNP